MHSRRTVKFFNVPYIYGCPLKLFIGGEENKNILRPYLGTCLSTEQRSIPTTPAIWLLFSPNSGPLSALASRPPQRPAPDRRLASNLLRGHIIAHRFFSHGNHVSLTSFRPVDVSIYLFVPVKPDRRTIYTSNTAKRYISVDPGHLPNTHETDRFAAS